MTWTLVVHGGAGTPPAGELTPDRIAAYEAGLRDALAAGGAVLAAGGGALAAVIAAVASLEDDPLFNAGRGATLTASGRVEMDASLMEGMTGRAGAVAGVTRIRNPIRAAEAVMRRTQHVLLAGPAADGFAAAEGLAMEDPAYFETPHRRAQLEIALRRGVVAQDHDIPAGPSQDISARSSQDISARSSQDIPARSSHDISTKIGTVGAVARDAGGRLAAATSTGGMTNKRDGRIGDSPLIGAGTWADRTVAVSCTGMGEAFIRCAAAHEISALMRHRGMDVQAAAEQVALRDVPAAGGSGGLIAVDAAGIPALVFGTPGMHRGVLRAGGAPAVAILREG